MGLQSGLRLSFLHPGGWGLLLLSLCLAACGTLQVGIEPTDTLPDHATASAPTPATSKPTPTEVPLTTATLVVTEPPPATATMESAPPTAAPARRPTSQPIAQPTPAPTPTLITPHIESFTADRAEVNLGESITFTWKALGASALLCVDAVLSRFPCGEFSGALPVEGSLAIPIQHALRPDSRQQFMLIVSPSDNPADPNYPTASATLFVNVHCPTPWFFTSAPDECAAAPALNSPAVVQNFERGRMIWLQATGQIFALFDQPRQFNPYNEYQDVWTPGLPESDPTLTPPDGLLQPVRGFGLAWRTYNLREQLGWATAPETNFQSIWQCNAGRGDAGNCYVRGPDGNVLALARGNAYVWKVWNGGP